MVLLPGLHRTVPANEWRLAEWMEQVLPAIEQEGDAVSQVLLAPIKHASEEHEAINKWIRDVNTQRDREELKRLLYVGCTRARQEVHLFAQCNELKNGQLGAPSKPTLLHTAWPVAKTNFIQHWSQQQDRDRTSAEIVEMPVGPDVSTEWPIRDAAGQVDSIAAAEDTSQSSRVIPLSNFQRLRFAWKAPEALADIPLAAPSQEEADEFDLEDSAAFFQRPQGSWRARVFGTVLHAFLEPLANVVQQNVDASEQARLIDALHQPIRLQLLSNGHPPKEAVGDATRIVTALHHMAADKDGRWILSEHNAPSIAQGSSLLHRGFEVSLTAVHRNILRSIRIDRVFVAGADPTSFGTDALWIIDFKTASHGAGKIEEFLAMEGEQYQEQMQLYGDIARLIYPEIHSLRLGLYYPLLARLSWWPYAVEQ